MKKDRRDTWGVFLIALTERTMFNRFNNGVEGPPGHRPEPV